MANYHFSVDIIKRSEGRSGVAAAAYRSGELLIDFRTGKRYDFRHKTDVWHKNILLPEFAPTWMKDRQALWNYVEQFEKRKDAQIARDVNFDLPQELNIKQNVELAEKFVKEVFVNKGMIADLAIHTKFTAEGVAQSHAHVMLTLRQVSKEGFGLKNVAWNSKDLLKDWRREWAEYANHYLAINGHKQRVDHRNLVDQGVALAPQLKRGNENYKFNGRRKAEHERIARENAERILADPSIATRALTRNQSTFSTNDIRAFAKRHSVNETQYAQVFEAIKNHKEIVQVQEYKDCFTTKQMLHLEMDMLNKANKLDRRQGHTVKEIEVTKPLSDEQREVLNHLIAKGDMKCVIGYAGSGKSYLLGAAREVWEQSGYKVEGVTLSGIAASGLQASSGIESRTLASRMSYWDKGEEQLTKDTVLVVDEAGMLGSRQIAKILKQVEKAEAKVVFIGDTEQLQAIEAGSAFRAIVDRTYTMDLTEIRRQEHKWQQEATKAFGQRKTVEAIQHYQSHGCIKGFDTKEMALSELVNEWNQERIYYPNQTRIMLTYTREDVKRLNEEARRLLKERNELGEDKWFSTEYNVSDPLRIGEQEFVTEEGKRTFAINDRILFLQNDRTLGVNNGTLGTVKGINGREVTVTLDDNKEVKFDATVYKNFDHGYATTIHKAQGVTIDIAYLLASKYLDAYGAYVGMTRHRKNMKMYWGKDEFKNKQELVKALSTRKAKALALEHVQKLDAYHKAVNKRSGLNPPWESSSQLEKAQWRALNNKARELAHLIVKDIHLNKMTQDMEIYKSIERDAKGYQMGQQRAKDLAMNKSQHKRVSMGIGW